MLYIHDIYMCTCINILKLKLSSAVTSTRPRFHGITLFHRFYIAQIYTVCIACYKNSVCVCVCVLRNRDAKSDSGIDPF